MLHIGTSGWQYRDWRGRFYPEKLPQRRWLTYYAEHFSTVEINNTFYRLPERGRFEDWAQQVPDDFIVAAKMSRYLTHIKRLNDSAEPVARFLNVSRGLGDRQGPVLLQLPPNLPAAPEALDATLSQFDGKVRVVVEPRHESWWSEEIRELLCSHGAALSWADRRSRVLTPLWRTADFGYLRLHEGRAHRSMAYGADALDSWLRRISEKFDDSDDVYVYFNNDPGGAAVDNARQLVERARAAGMTVAGAARS